MENQQFQAMLEPAIQRLKKYTVEELCQKAHISFDEESQEFVLKSLNEEIRIEYPSFHIKNELEMWHHLTILQYMDTADGIDLSEEWISLTQMRGGVSRGMGYEKEISEIFKKKFSTCSIDDFKKACEKLGGTIIKSKADSSAIISYLPMFPVCIHFWEADDEFPASGKVLIDGHAEHYLTLEAAGVACETVLQEMVL